MRRDPETLSECVFDLVVIGGGIYGACAAWDAALRGLTVALIEQGDFGEATSANSQKVVHGGLRYLQTLDLKRMRESVRERRALLKIAPHLVHPLPFLIPTYGRGKRGRSAMAAAFRVADLVGRDRNRGISDPRQRIPKSRVVSRGACARVAPGLTGSDITGGALWHDAQVYNSERLTLAFVHSAAEVGAEVANYLTVRALRHDGDRVTGVEVEDRLTGRRFAVRGRVVLNTSGPWLERVCGLLNGAVRKRRADYVKAINIVTRRPLTAGVAVGVEDPRESRLFFLTPWRDRSVIGTAYTRYEGDPEACRATDEEVQRLLDGVNRAYPAAALRRDDVAFVHVGLLPASKGRVEPEAQYRLIDHAAEDGMQGLVSVRGVKYTTARDVAEKAIDLAVRKLGRGRSRSRSADFPLRGATTGEAAASIRDARLGRPEGVEADVWQQLVNNYGSEAARVLTYGALDPVWRERVSSASPVLKAQVVYAVREEMAQTLQDVVFRRTELGTAGHPGEDALRGCLWIMADELGWGMERMDREMRETDAVFARHGARPVEFAGVAW